MTSSVWYPANISRRDRLNSLIDNIANEQKDISDTYENMEIAHKSTFNALEELRKRANLPSMKALQQKILSELPPEAQEHMKNAIEDSEAFEQNTDIAITTGGLVYSSAKAAGVAVNAITFFATFPFLRAIKQITRGFHLIATEGLQVGLSFLKSTVKGISILAKTSKIAGTLGKALRIVGKIASAVQYLAIGADIITMIWQIAEESKQRTKLIENIHIAQPARIAVSYFKHQAGNSIQYVNTLGIYTEAWADGAKGNMEAKITAQYMAKSMAKKVNDANDVVTLDKEIQKWKTLDKDNDKYTADDLSDDDLKKKVEDDIEKFEEEAKKAAKEDS